MDLLILLIQLSEEGNQLYLYKKGVGKCPDKVFSITNVWEHLSEVSSSVLFLHIMTGCDTTCMCLVQIRQEESLQPTTKKQELRHQLRKNRNCGAK